MNNIKLKNIPKVSVIIPVVKINDYIRESVPKIFELDYPDFEVIILPDDTTSIRRQNASLRSLRGAPTHGGRGRRSNPILTQSKKIRIIPSGRVGPAEKRDLAARHAKGDILAFLDDDAYPRKDWLKRAAGHFSNPRVAAVGGPAITPASDTAGQKISGAVFESYLGGGMARNRYLSIGRAKEIDDWPTVNLLVRKDIFKRIGGFDCAYWPGEDTKLCLDIIEAGHKIIYEPRAIVYHHRRAGVLKHLKQISNYALHRGYFAKRHPKTSLKLAYFVPTLFVLYLAALVILTLSRAEGEVSGPRFFILDPSGVGIQNDILLVPLAVYFLGLIIDASIISTRWRDPFIGLATVLIIFLTHVWYGIRFVWGLVLPKLKK